MFRLGATTSRSTRTAGASNHDSETRFAERQRRHGIAEPARLVGSTAARERVTNAKRTRAAGIAAAQDTVLTMC